MLHRAQDADRVGHVVQHLDGHDEVVVAGDGGIGGVAHLEPGPVGDAGVGRRLLRATAIDASSRS